MSQLLNERWVCTPAQLTTWAHTVFLTIKFKARINLTPNFAAKKVSLNAWITLPEFSKWLKLAIWACGETRFISEYNTLIKRIRRLVKTNGWNFTFKYLKECLRLVVRYLAGTPETTRSRNAIGVRVNQYGLPVLIPSTLRQVLDLTEGNRATVRTVLTVLSIFRSFSTKVKPDLGTITAPFHGISRTLEIEGVAKAWVGGDLRLPPITGFISDSAGPIAKRATWGAPVDAFALLGYPRVALRVLNTLLTSKGGGAYAFSLLALWCLYLVPFILQVIMFGSNSRFPLGRLSVVYDQAGKARIVALANWWIQLSLLPLHKSIFRLLKTKECDGTFNQLAPLKRLMSNPQIGEKFSCFDLSSATDRIPVQVQVQILNAIGVDGYAWQELLSFPYFYKGEPVEYSVGQPMGAYSSWAMLALTHHLIVMLAASRLGIREFSSYAVLGDDIIINDDDVAAEYLDIMNVLGVGINASKSIVSDRFGEFAKRYVSPTFDISPIGSGNLLQAARRPQALGSLIVEMYTKSVIRDFGNGLIPLYLRLPIKEAFSKVSLWTWWMLCQAIASTHPETSLEASENTSGMLDDPRFDEAFSQEFLWGLRTVVLRDLLESYSKAKAEEKLLFKQVLYELRHGKSKSIKLIQAFGFLLSPVLYLYWLGLLRSTETIRNKYVESALVSPGIRGTTVAFFLREYTPMQLSVRVTRSQIRDQTKFVRSLTNTYLDIMDRSRSRY